MRLFTSILLKFVRRPATLITLGVMVVLVVLIYLMLAASLGAIPDPEQRAALASIFTFPDAYGALAGMLLTFALLAAAAYAGSLAGGEWNWGSFRVAIARGESRTRYVLLNFAAIGLLSLFGFAVLFVVGVLIGLVAGAMAGIERGDALAAEALVRLPAIILGGSWVVIMAAAIAFAIGFALRSAVAGLVAVVALYFGEQVGAIVVPADILGLAPISAGTRLLRGVSEPGGAGEPLVALAITTAYVALALLALVVVARRVEAA